MKNFDTYSNHDEDFYAWAIKNSELLRQKKFEEIDVDNIAEEIESMGKSERRELVNRLSVLIAHLLKWQYQPKRQGKSWMLTIKQQRLQINKLLKNNPSLKNKIEFDFKDAYEGAIIIAADETKILEEDFPKHCPFDLDDCLDNEFLPG